MVLRTSLQNQFGLRLPNMWTFLPMKGWTSWTSTYFKLQSYITSPIFKACQENVKNNFKAWMQLKISLKVWMQLKINLLMVVNSTCLKPTNQIEFVEIYTKSSTLYFATWGNTRCQLLLMKIRNGKNEHVIQSWKHRKCQKKYVCFTMFYKIDSPWFEVIFLVTLFKIKRYTNVEVSTISLVMHKK